MMKEMLMSASGVFDMQIKNQKEKKIY